MPCSARAASNCSVFSSARNTIDSASVSVPALNDQAPRATRLVQSTVRSAGGHRKLLRVRRSAIIGSTSRFAKASGAPARYRFRPAYLSGNHAFVERHRRLDGQTAQRCSLPDCAHSLPGHANLFVAALASPSRHKKSVCFAPIRSDAVQFFIVVAKEILLPKQRPAFAQPPIASGLPECRRGLGYTME